MNYLLLTATATALFFVAYWFLMRHEKRHTMVRYYLIGSLLLSFLLPAIHLRLAVPTWYPQNSSESQDVATLQVGTTLAVTGEGPVSATMTQLVDDEQPGHADMPLWMWIWMAGGVASAALLAVRLVVLWRRMRGLPFEERDGMKVALVNDDTAAFSFGNHIVVGTKGFSEIEVQQLVGHETVHVRQGHTADTLLCELAKAVLWFNPFIYLYARELKRVHEYIADSAMMSASYAELFYHQVSGRSYSPLANGFDYRMVHQRIAMMAQRRHHGGWLKPLAAVPIAAVVLLAACAPKSNSLLVGQWEYVGISREFIYDDGQTNFQIMEDEPDNTYPRISDLDFRADGTATVVAWDVSKWVTAEEDDATKVLKPDDSFDYTTYAVEWQIVADTLLMCNEKGGREAFQIVSLNEDTLVFVSSSIFRPHDHSDDGITRETYTYRRKK